MRALLPPTGQAQYHTRHAALHTTSTSSPRCRCRGSGRPGGGVLQVQAKLQARPVTTKGGSSASISSKKQQLQSQLQRQERQQKKTLVGSNTTRGLRGNNQQQQPPRQPQQPQQQQQQQRRGSRFYFNITGFPFPLGPFFERNTVRTEVVPGQVWTFEQTQGLFFDVFTPVRMTVIKLRSGGLWVHAPVAPTQECINLIKELGAPVQYIMLPTFAYEHKVFVGPFSRRFPKAKVYVTPFQWSFPLNLPPQFFGIFPAGTLRDGDTTTPWGEEIEQKLLSPPPIGVSEDVRLTEASFFHKPSKTLLVTDAVVYVDRDPPSVIPAQALRSQAQDGWLQRYLAGGRSRAEIEAVAVKGRVEDTPEARRTAWARMSLLVLYFNPSDLLTPQASFDAISRRLIVGPVVRTLVYNKIPNTVCDWVDSMVADWRFERIIPAHFHAPIRAGPSDLQAAFAWCYKLAGRSPRKAAGGGGGSISNPFSGLLGLFGGGGSGSSSGSSSSDGGRRGMSGGFPEEDVKVLQGLNDALLRLKVVYDDAERRA